MVDAFKGYKGRALDTLKQFSVRVWSEATVLTSRGTFAGTPAAARAAAA